jgi:hypothetical protein
LLLFERRVNIQNALRQLEHSGSWKVIEVSVNAHPDVNGGCAPQVPQHGVESKTTLITIICRAEERGHARVRMQVY